MRRRKIGEEVEAKEKKPNVTISEKKKKAVDRFVSELRRRLGLKILGVYLFGSTAKGTATPDSDIDVLVVYKGLEERKLLEITSEISFDIALSSGESIETVAMTEEEYKKDLGSSPFLWEVLTFGKSVFTTPRATKWKLDFKDHLDFAIEYLNYAKGALQRNELRLAIDAGYNSAELLVKALIISTRNPLASSHGGLVTQLGNYLF